MCTNESFDGLLYCTFGITHYFLIQNRKKEEDFIEYYSNMKRKVKSRNFPYLY